MGQAGHWGQEPYLNFHSCPALCACAWPKAEPCVVVCGHVSFAAISLNFLLKCQPTRLWWGVNSPIDRLLFCLCCCPSGASWPSVDGGYSTAENPLHGPLLGRAAVLGQKQRTERAICVFGSRLVCGTWTCGFLKMGEWACLGGCTVLILSLFKIMVFFLWGISLVFYSSTVGCSALGWMLLLSVLWCCIHRNRRRGQLTPACPCCVLRSSEEPRSIIVQCLPALGEELLCVCHRAGYLWQHCMFFPAEIDWFCCWTGSISLYLGIGFPCGEICGF